MLTNLLDSVNTELNVLKEYISNPTLRGLFISHGDKILFNRIISEFPVANYTPETQRIEFPAGGHIYVAPFYCTPMHFWGLTFNLIVIQPPYPDPYVSEILTRLIPTEGDTISPQLYYGGQPKIAESPANGPIKEG